MNLGLRHLISIQAGVVSRAQAIDNGLSDQDIRRLVRRREWTPIHRGVYVNHTGVPTWLQRAWAAVLFCAPAALAGESALRAAYGPGRRDRGDDGPIHVMIDHARRLPSPPEGLVVVRSRAFGQQTRLNTSPPRQRFEDAALDVAIAERDDVRALAVLAAAVQSRRTTARRMLVSLQSRGRAKRRTWLLAVLRDIVEGTCFVLEHEYLTRVERAHGLPTAMRQQRATASTGLVFRDAEYVGGLVVELDGRIFHDNAEQRDRDLDRDLDAAVDGKQTIRLGWGQVHVRGCHTALRLAQILSRTGWAGRPVGCGPGCPVAAMADSEAA